MRPGAGSGSLVQVGRVDTLSDRRPDLRPEEFDYLIVLALLIERYEEDLYPMAPEAGEPSTGPTS